MQVAKSDLIIEFSVVDLVENIVGLMDFHNNLLLTGSKKTRSNHREQIGKIDLTYIQTDLIYHDKFISGNNTYRFLFPIRFKRGAEKTIHFSLFTRKVSVKINPSADHH